MLISRDISAPLRDWPRTLHDRMEPAMRDALETIAAMFASPHLVAAWEYREEPGLTIARLADGAFENRVVENDATYRPLAADSVERSVFFIDDVTAAGDIPVHPLLAAEVGAKRLLILPILSEAVEGCVLVGDPGVEIDAALCDATAVAALLASSIDWAARCRRVRSEVAADERLRVARDLHDGLLQSFTGIVLQLETVHALVERDPADAQRLLTRLQSALMADQRELRAYVEALRPKRRSELTFDFAARVRDMCQRFEEQWGTRVNVETGGVDPHVGGMLGQETFRIVQEAVTNAARHGGASRVDVTLRTTGDVLILDVADNGTGLPMRGRMSLSEMIEKGIGPSSLGERVAALNGRGVAESSEEGLRLEIELPLGWAGA